MIPPPALTPQLVLSIPEKNWPALSTFDFIRPIPPAA
jgi:hypothetical protein